MLDFRSRCIALTPIAPFTLAVIFIPCAVSPPWALASASCAKRMREKSVEGSGPSAFTSPLARQLFTAFTEGSIRYRLDYVDKGHQRGAVRLVANRAYALCPEILNDASEAPWFHGSPSHGPWHFPSNCARRLTPDPRLYYRTDDVWAASHPPLAACMARIAGRVDNEIAWDPFCGSGVGLIECALRGGVKKVFGTDLDAKAIAIAQANFAAAKLPSVTAQFANADFLQYAKIPGLGPQSVTLIITNPPMGRRVRVPNLRGLIANLFTIAAQALKPGGRLVFANPLKLDSPDRSLKLQSRQTVDLGGFDCQLELYRKDGP